MPLGAAKCHRLLPALLLRRRTTPGSRSSSFRRRSAGLVQERAIRVRPAVRVSRVLYMYEGQGYVYEGQGRDQVLGTVLAAPRSAPDSATESSNSVADGLPSLDEEWGSNC